MSEERATLNLPAAFRTRTPPPAACRAGSSQKNNAVWQNQRHTPKELVVLLLPRTDLTLSSYYIYIISSKFKSFALAVTQHLEGLLFCQRVDMMTASLTAVMTATSTITNKEAEKPWQLNLDGDYDGLPLWSPPTTARTTGCQKNAQRTPTANMTTNLTIWTAASSTPFS